MTSNGNLPPAIPVFEPDLEQAWTQIGRLSCQVEQLQRELLRRAKETNVVHDQLLEAISLLKGDGRLEIKAFLDKVGASG